MAKLTAMINEDDPTAKNNLAPFTPTMPQVQKISIEMMKLESCDVLFDLGCGDGRMLVAAAEANPGIKCVGIELHPLFAERAMEAVKSLPPDVSDRIEIRKGDVLDSVVLDGGYSLKEDALSLMEDATAIFLFLMPRGLEKILPLMEMVAQRRKEQGKAFRVISYIFSMKTWNPVKVDRTTKGDVAIYLYNLSSLDTEQIIWES